MPVNDQILTGSNEEPREIDLCLACARPVERGTHFCPLCGAPLTSFAATDPMSSIQARGEMVRRAFRRPQGIVLVGIWLIFGPATLISACFFWMFLNELGQAKRWEESLTIFVELMGPLFFMLLLGSILARMTGAYFADPAASESQQHDESACG